jgi:hypothetical protein
MTLIITIVTENKVVQASDRRVTFADGSVRDDISNKAIFVGCKTQNFLLVIRVPHVLDPRILING